MSDNSITRIIERIAGLEGFRDNHDKFADDRQATILKQFDNLGTRIDRIDGRIMWLVGILILFISGSYAWTNICKADNRNYMEKNNDIVMAKIEKLQDNSSEMISQMKIYFKKYAK